MAGKLSDHELNNQALVRQADLVANPPYLLLFKNNILPDEGSLLSALVEASFPGYARQVLDYSPSIVVVGHTYSITPGALVFTRAAGAGGDLIYGYAVLDSTQTWVLWSQRDPVAPIDLTIVGATYTVTATRRFVSG